MREPLVHFLVLGLILFAIFEMKNPSESSVPHKIEITASEINWFRETWSRQWNREPDSDDMRRLVIGYLKEKLLAEEALALGLDQDDTIIRRRLALKMEFLFKNSSQVTAPDESILKEYYIKNTSRYKTNKIISFRQVYFKNQQAATQNLKSINNKEELIGATSLLPKDMLKVDEAQVESVFGVQFAKNIFNLTSNKWHGPIKSNYGYHLVLINEVYPSRTPIFSEVSSKVLIDWEQEQQEKFERQLIASLLKKHTVLVDNDVHDLVNPILRDFE